MNVLDVGCGSTKEHFPLEGKNIISMSIERTNFNKEILDYVCDAHFLPFKDNSFDVVYCGHTLEHCDSPLIVLHELKRVAKQKIMLKVPSLKMVIDEEDPHHIYTWSKSSFSNLLAKVFSKYKVYETNRNDKWINTFPFFRKTFHLFTHLLPFFQNELTAICWKSNI